MQINCKQCGHEIPAADVNIDALIAKCSVCNAVFGFADDVDKGEASRGRRPRRAKVPLPPRFSVNETGRGLQIVHRWWRPMFIFLAFFCVMWFGFLAAWYAMAMATESPVFFLLFPLIHVAIGIGLGYFTLAGFVNRTVIDVNGQALRIRHGPLPWFGNRTIPSDSLDQLYVIRRAHSARQTHGTQFSYDVRAVNKRGEQLKVLEHLAEPEQALYIEQAVEDRLGIENLPVPGALQ